ncbi:MAG: DUF3458 domain-containing protein, partial [Gemmobacter sp.]|nr:DUF3458 domain-containing protein [Gemmobacter sp.]
ALDLYFDRHDGQACTIEDWLTVFQDATGRDLTQFRRWYTQGGTPRVKVSDHWADGTYTLTLEQMTSPTPDQPEKAPQVIPVAVGLLNHNGDEVVPTTVLELTESRQSFRFDGLAAQPVPSILRGFSAPVILDHDQTDEERAFLLAHDTDPFNRWEAGRALAKQVLARMVTDDASPGADWLAAMARVLRDDTLDPAFRALTLRLPGEDDMAQTLHTAGIVPDPDRIWRARKRLGEALAKYLAADLQDTYEALAVPGPYSPDARAAGQRALRLAVLSLISRLDGGMRATRAVASADNMTDRIGALGCLIEAGGGGPELATFERDWRGNRLVMDKWFAIQIAHAAPADAVAVTARLTTRADFDWKNPNRFRAAIGALAGNHAGFHRADGSGYRLVADWLIRLDGLNPQTAARMSTSFDTLSRYDADRQALMRDELRRILAAPGLSRDLGEMAGRMLG